MLGVEHAVGAAAIAEDNAQVAAKILDLDRVSEAPSDVDRSWLNDRSITSKRYLIKFITYCFKSVAKILLRNYNIKIVFKFWIDFN